METSEIIDPVTEISVAALGITNRIIEFEDEHSKDEGESKMMHMMHSDTITVVLSLVVMIALGLVFRSICNKVTSINERKARVRGGLKRMAESMNYVTRSMSNDLVLPNCPKAVMRTYSNMNRKSGGDGSQKGDMPTKSMRKQAINNNLTQEEKEELQRQMCMAQSVSIQMER